VHECLTSVRWSCAPTRAPFTIVTFVWSDWFKSEMTESRLRSTTCAVRLRYNDSRR
jgi:hypothetical protein